MVTIRLARRGAKNRPFYNAVVADSRKPRDGRFIEKIGFYDPLMDPKKGIKVKLDLQKVEDWVRNGAKLSAAIERLIKVVRKKDFTIK